MQGTEDKEPIFDLAAECERLFEAQVETLTRQGERNGAKIVMDQSQRFAAWTSFLGVFAESNMCLDRRLQHHVEIQDQVLLLLDIMHRSLKFLFETEDSPGKPDNSLPDHGHSLHQTASVDIHSLEAISGALERLNQLGIAIRQSSVRSKIIKARKLAESFDLASFGEIAYLSLKSLYPDASEGLIEQLSQSMTETFALFLQRKSRQQQLQLRRPRPQTRLRPLVEELEEGAEMGQSAEDVIMQDLPATNAPREDSLRPHPLPRAAFSIPESTPTSLNSKEVHAKLKKMLSPSTKRKTISILVNHVDYPRPVKGSLTCNWCFTPLLPGQYEGPKWRKHVNQDHEPFVCLAEKCVESTSRFSTSTLWSEHMQTIHGQDWHCNVHAPLLWVCPLCTSEEIKFSRSEHLTVHIAHSHGSIFTESQVQAIAQQSQFRVPRPKDVCPLCCLPMENPQSSEVLDCTSKEPPAKRLRHEETSGRKASIDTPSKSPLSSDTIAAHVAIHLQGIMLLTLRLISIDGAVSSSADNQSSSGATDDHSSWAGSKKDSMHSEPQNAKELSIPSDDEIGVDHDSYSGEIVPDSEYTDWVNVPRCYDDHSTDSFIEEVIRSGAFQPSPLSLAASSSNVHNWLIIRDEIIRNLIDTERLFGKSMHALNEIYDYLFYNRPSTADYGKKLRLIFGNCELILNFSLNLQDALANVCNVRVSESGVIGHNLIETNQMICVGDIFFQQIERIENIFILYATNRVTSKHELTIIDSGEAQWITTCLPRASDLVTLQDLDNALDKPLDWVLTYSRLLCDLFDTTPSDHPDYSIIPSVLKELSRISNTTNHFREQAEAIQDISILRAELSREDRPSPRNIPEDSIWRSPGRLGISRRPGAGDPISISEESDPFSGNKFSLGDFVYHITTENQKEGPYYISHVVGPGEYVLSDLTCVQVKEGDIFAEESLTVCNQV